MLQFLLSAQSLDHIQIFGWVKYELTKPWQYIGQRTMQSKLLLLRDDLPCICRPPCSWKPLRVLSTLPRISLTRVASQFLRYTGKSSDNLGVMSSTRLPSRKLSLALILREYVAIRFGHGVFENCIPDEHSLESWRWKYYRRHQNIIIRLDNTVSPPPKDDLALLTTITTHDSTLSSLKQRNSIFRELMLATQK